MVSVTDDKFDELIEELVIEIFKRNPGYATYLGLHEWDHLVPDLSRESIKEYITFLKTFIRKLEELDETALSGTRVIDYPVVLNNLKLQLVTLEEWPLWKMYPVGIETLGELIFPLLIGEHLPVEHRVMAIESRLKQMHKYVGNSIQAVDKPFKLWISYALMAGKGLPALLESVKALGKSAGSNELIDIADSAKEMLSKYLSQVNDLLEKSSPGFKPIGKDLFKKILRLRFIDEDPDVLRKIGYEEADKYRSYMEKAAKDLGAKTIEEGLEVLTTARSYDMESFKDLYAAVVDRIRAFIYTKGIVDLPAGERIKLIDTPDYLKPVIPFAAYSPPETFSYTLRGLYFVTPPASEEMLKHLSFYDILNTAVHEAYPGHHTQLVIAKLKSPILRRLLASSDFVEGWAHYTEELMLEEGLDDSPHYRLKVWHDALWRAVRVYLDIELHTMGLSYEEGVEKLSRDAYLPKQGAQGEVLRYTMTPTYQLCYNYGKRVIKGLREEVKKILGQRYSNSLFHKLLLEEGNLPVNILRKLVIKKAKELAE